MSACLAAQLVFFVKYGVFADISRIVDALCRKKKCDKSGKTHLGPFSGLKHDFLLIIGAFCTIFHGDSEFDGISEKMHFLTGEA